MPTEEYSPEVNRRKTEVGALVSALMMSAKSASLYKAGHPMIAQIAERVRQLLVKTLGADATLVLDIKAKSVILEECEVPGGAEISSFANALHTLGVGQLLLTQRLSTEGLIEFFRVLAAKADEHTTLTDLQKAIQGLRIDGLQMVFILSFVVTGEQEQKDQRPGQLSEGQIEAFLRASTLADFLWLLLKQNEDLTGKEADAVGDLLEAALYREASLEKLETELDWSLYDPRIAERWRTFRAAMAWAPKKSWAAGKDGPELAPVKPRPRWDGAGLRSWCCLVEEAELKSLQEHAGQEKRAALAQALSRLHALLDAPGWRRHRKHVLNAYLRCLGELGRDGEIPVLLEELSLWQSMEKTEPPEAYAALTAGIREKALTPATAEQFARFLMKVRDVSDDAVRLVELALLLGPKFVPLLLEQLRGLQDKSERAKLCVLLTSMARAQGDAELVAALQDPDWLLAAHVVGILQELGRGDRAALVAPLLQRDSRKLRDAAVKFLSKFGGTQAVEAIGAFAAASDDAEEAGKAVIALSRLDDPGVDAKLVEAYRKTKLSEIKVAVCWALSRFPSPASIALLKEAAARTWYEVITGLKKDLHAAARGSLEQLRKEGKA